MKIQTLALTLALAFPAQALIYDWLNCPFIDTSLEYFLGTKDSCDCRNRPTVFTRYCPESFFLFCFGIDAECETTSDDDRETAFKLAQRGGFVETELCMDIDWPEKGNPTACLNTNYYLRARDVFTPDHTPTACTVFVNGTRCKDCTTVGGRAPLPYVEFDCGNMVPEGWNGFNKTFEDWQDGQPRNGGRVRRREE